MACRPAVQTVRVRSGRRRAVTDPSVRRARGVGHERGARGSRAGRALPRPAVRRRVRRVPDELVGYRGPSACQIAGITYRQLDYWARTALVVPSIRSAAGSGSQRLYSFKDILVLKIVKRLLDTGISLHNIRVAVDHLRQRGVRDLANITLFSDGTTVYECTLGRGGRRPAAGRPGRVRHRRLRRDAGADRRRSPTSRWSAPTAASRRRARGRALARRTRRAIS